MSTGDDDITVLGSNEGNSSNPTDTSRSPDDQSNSKDTQENTNNDNNDESYCMADINAAEIDTFEELPSTLASTGDTHLYLLTSTTYIHTITYHISV